MKVLIACEESQEVCKAFRELGHEAYSCDILPCSGGHPEWHFQDDVLKHLDGWDLIIAFPPCTHLAVSGAKHFKKKIADGRQQEGIDFFMKLANCNCERLCIENPIGIMSSKFRKPDQIIQPYMFGHKSKKTTCLWLKNLPLLKPTDIVEPELIRYKDGSVFSKDYMNCKRSKPGESSVLRSKTYPGIAKAMANQYGKMQMEANKIE